jgi:RNA polymerase sigma-70 factor (ECF subfamily)
VSDRWREEQAVFYRAHYSRLLGAVYLFCGDREVAEDVVQEAMIRAFVRWNRVRRLDAPQAWVYRVALNLSRSVATRRARESAKLPLVAAVHAASESNGEEATAVRHSVAALPPRQRAAVILRYFVSLSVKETADALGCREGTVKALTHQGIVALRSTPGFAPAMEGPHD